MSKLPLAAPLTALVLLGLAAPLHSAVRGQFDVQGDGSTGVIDLDHPFLNGNPGALLMVAARDWNASVGFDVDYDFSYWRITSNGPVIPSNAHYAVLAFDAGSGFRHVTTGANIPDLLPHLTVLDEPRLNGQPNARPIVTPERSSTGIPVPFPIGVWYDSGIARWTIHYQDINHDMPVGASFSVFVPGAGEPSFIHTADAGNVNSNYTTINTGGLDHSAPHRIFVTQRWIGTYNNEWIGVAWLFSFLIGNIDGSAMPVGAAFNVYVAPIFANGFEDAGTTLWSWTEP